MKAMIFAAGLGTRLKPLTNNTPKALVEINGKTLLERCILNLKKNGIKEIIINIHHFADQMVESIQSLSTDDLNISISDEREELLDTGGGLLKARKLLEGEEPILLINVDILTNINFEKLLAFHQQNKALATLVVRKRSGSRYLLFNNDGILTGWKNIQTKEVKISRADEIDESTPLSFSGIHIIDPKMLDLIEENGKFSIIDLYLRLAKTHALKAYLDEESIWMDLGKYDQLEEAKRMVKSFDQADTIN